jgi:hypothetical protein
VREAGQVLGSRVRVQVTKSKVAPAWQTAELAVMADCGVLAVSSAEHDAA